MKDIPGYEGIYACDEKGCIYSLPRKIKKMLNTGKTFNWQLPLKKLSRCVRRDGYLQVHLRKDGKGKSCLSHRLIAKTFLNVNKEEINHIDGNKKNNMLNNLEISTRSDNIKHAFRTGLRSHKGINHPRYFIGDEIKKQVRLLLKKKLSQQKIATVLGISQVSVSKIKLKKI